MTNVEVTTTRPVATYHPENNSKHQFSQVPRLPLGVKRYSLVYAYSTGSPHSTVLLVKKPEGSMHPGLWNLPGGVTKEGETSEQSALRELQEETGVEASLPQYMGAILPTKAELKAGIPPWFVAVYNCQYNPSQALAVNEHNSNWFPIGDIARTGGKDPKCLPNLPLIIALCRSGMFGWSIQDGTSREPGIVEQSEITDFMVHFPNSLFTGEKSTEQMPLG